MKNNLLILWLILLMLITSFFVGRCVGINYVPNTYVEHFNDTILHSDTIIDTLYLTETKPSYITKIKEDTVYIKDTTVITVPIEEYTFTDSTNYECKVDGFKVKLKEMKLYPKTIKDEIEITNTIIKEKKNRFSIGIGVGIGYGVINKKPDLYIGINTTYKLWN